MIDDRILFCPTIGLYCSYMIAHSREAGTDSSNVSRDRTTTGLTERLSVAGCYRFLCTLGCAKRQRCLLEFVLIGVVVALLRGVLTPMTRNLWRLYETRMRLLDPEHLVPTFTGRSYTGDGDRRFGGQTRDDSGKFAYPASTRRVPVTSAPIKAT